MITVLVIWKERGYLRETFLATESCAPDQAAATVRRLIAAARQQNPGVFHVRAKIGGAR